MSKTRLAEAVRTMKVDEVLAILARDPGLLAFVDVRKRNLLHLACAVKCETVRATTSEAVRLVKHLLAKGLDPDSPLVADGYRLNPVWFAVAHAKNVALVELLVKRGARPVGLFAAAWHEHLPMLKALLRAGADVEEVVHDETPFLHAWKNRRFASSELLAKAGANVDFRDKKRMTALHYALDRSYEPARVRALVRHGASGAIADARGVTAAEKASRKKDPAYAAALLAAPKRRGARR